MPRLSRATVAGVEDVCFHHAAKRWGANFSTVEIGKARIRQFYTDRNIDFHEYKGHETREIRTEFGYRKIKDKAADRFESTVAIRWPWRPWDRRGIEPGPVPGGR